MHDRQIKDHRQAKESVAAPRQFGARVKTLPSDAEIAAQKQAMQAATAIAKRSLGGG